MSRSWRLDSREVREEKRLGVLPLVVWIGERLAIG